MVNDQKKIIILGSSGFIGAHLVSWFKSQGYNVAGIDIVRDGGLVPGLKKADQFYQLALPDQRFGEILKEIRPDAVINASGPASVANSFLEPASDFNGSVNVCLFVLESIRNILPTCHLLFLSSAAVYGNPVAFPVNENMSIKPISPYGYHKTMCEGLAQEFFDIYGISTSIVRIFSAYGPGLKKQILWDIYQKAKINKQVCLFGTGEETRDFIFIRDIASAIQIILEKSNFKGDVYNIANGYEVSIQKLGKLFLSALEMENVEMIFSGETKLGDPKRWCADISKIQRMGYLPSVSLSQGIFEYAKWLINLRDNS